MTSWVTWIVAGVILSVLIYAIYSVFVKKSTGIYISAVVHIALGVLSLILIDFLFGLCVLGLAILEQKLATHSPSKSMI